MAGTKDPVIAIKQPDDLRSSNIQLASPPQSPDHVFRRPGPGILKKRIHQRRKSVQWDKGTIDNEHKRSTRPPSPIPYTPNIPTSYWSTVQALKRAAQAQSVVNTSARVNPTSSRAPDLRSQPSLSRSNPREQRAPRLPTEDQAANVSSRREPENYRRSFTSRAQQPVPDPPQRLRPPPTPRPARLPTPNLPDIGDRMFCDCYGPACDKSHGKNDRPVYVKQDKMDAQLEAAKAYMKGRK